MTLESFCFLSFYTKHVISTLVTESTRPQNLPHLGPSSPAVATFARAVAVPGCVSAAPRPPRAARARPWPHSRARLHRRTCAFRAAPQATASMLRSAPGWPLPGRAALPRSAAASWLRARGVRRTRRRQRGLEQARGEALRPHYGRHRPPCRDLSTGQPDAVVKIDDDDEAVSNPCGC